MSFIKNFIKTKSPNQTVFSLSDLANISGGHTGAKLNSSLKFAVAQKDLIRISKALYVLDKNYSKLEFSNKFRSPSYISFYTVFAQNGIVFQPYSSIYTASSRSEEVMIDNQIYIYRKIKDEILLNPFGIHHDNFTFIASSERAICDKLYLDGEEYFDNLKKIDWQFMKEINEKVYDNNKVISKFIKNYQK